MPMQAFNVRLNGKLIDTVFYTPNAKETAKEASENTRRSLIDHDGYDAGITVVKARKHKSAVERSQDTLIAGRYKWLKENR